MCFTIDRTAERPQTDVGYKVLNAEEYGWRGPYSRYLYEPWITYRLHDTCPVTSYFYLSAEGFYVYAHLKDASVLRRHLTARWLHLPSLVVMKCRVLPTDFLHEGRKWGAGPVERTYKAIEVLEVVNEQ